MQQSKPIQTLHPQIQTVHCADSITVDSTEVVDNPQKLTDELQQVSVASLMMYGDVEHIPQRVTKSNLQKNDEENVKFATPTKENHKLKNKKQNSEEVRRLFLEQQQIINSQMERNVITYTGTESNLSIDNSIEEKNNNQNVDFNIKKEDLKQIGKFDKISKIQNDNNNNNNESEVEIAKSNQPNLDIPDCADFREVRQLLLTFVQQKGNTHSHVEVIITFAKIPKFNYSLHKKKNMIAVSSCQICQVFRRKLSQDAKFWKNQFGVWPKIDR